MRRGNDHVSMPKWAIWCVGLLLATSVGGAAAWARQIDVTNSTILQDVAALKQSRQDLRERLIRLESKVDQLLERGN